ncbi:MAG: DUF975 family protein [Lachnospiraceae bacterium]
MWTRADLKARGRIAFKKNYWAAVVVSLILSIVIGGAMTGAGASKTVTRRVPYTYQGATDLLDRGWNEHMPDIDTYYNGHNAGIRWILAIFIMSVGIAGIMLRIFLGYPLAVGGRRFYMENRESQPKIGTILSMFKGNGYGNVVLTMFLKDLFTGLWTLLFVIPGIVKSYEYRMIPYILAEHPDMNREQAFALSKQMMMGQKFDMFVLDLSYAGWYILSGVTCGILAIFYVMPYIDATEAEVYAVFRAHAFHTGGVTTNDLPGFGPTYY